MFTVSFRPRNAAAGVVGGLMLMAGGQAIAWDGFATGTIGAFEVAGGNNFGFRVHLVGGAAVCTGGPGWGYLNESDSNYKTFTAVLMMAKAQGSPVSLYSNLENGYCHIAHVSVG
jgi:hypothetical protein